MAFQLIPLVAGPGPIAVTGPGPNGELYLADQNGVIMTYSSGVSSIFLDLRNQIPPLNPDYDERGLLDILISPRKDRIFAFYTSLSGHNLLAEIDLRTKAISPLLRILEPSDIHNGGRMAFGPDGHLYLGTGDGGPPQNLLLVPEYLITGTSDKNLFNHTSKEIHERSHVLLDRLELCLYSGCRFQYWLQRPIRMISRRLR